MTTKGTLEWLMEFPPDVFRLLEWYLSETTKRYSFAMMCGGIDDVIQETCLELMSMGRKYTRLPCRWTTACTNQAHWCMSRMWELRKRHLTTCEDLERSGAMVEKHYYVEETEVVVDRSDLKLAFEAALKTLTYREREIINLWFGLGDGHAYNLEEIGRIFKVTRERIRQIAHKGLKKLQRPIRASLLKGFANDREMGYSKVYDELDEIIRERQYEKLYGRRPKYRR